MKDQEQSTLHYHERLKARKASPFQKSKTSLKEAWLHYVTYQSIRGPTIMKDRKYFEAALTKTRGKARGFRKGRKHFHEGSKMFHNFNTKKK